MTKQFDLFSLIMNYYSHSQQALRLRNKYTLHVHNEIAKKSKRQYRKKCRLRIYVIQSKVDKIHVHIHVPAVVFHRTEIRYGPSISPIPRCDPILVHCMLQSPDMCMCVSCCALYSKGWINILFQSSINLLNDDIKQYRTAYRYSQSGMLLVRSVCILYKPQYTYCPSVFLLLFMMSL